MSSAALHITVAGWFGSFEVGENLRLSQSLTCLHSREISNFIKSVSSFLEVL